MQLGELIYDIGGGIPNGKEFKAAQIGGPSGGCIPKQHLNVPVDYESLQELGAIMGSGGLIVMDEDTCMVDIARFFLDFIQDETCGKCPPCRVGTKRMLEIVDAHLRRRGRGRRHRAPHRPRRDHQRDRALRPRPDGAEPGALAPSATSATSTRRTSSDKHCAAGVCATLFKAPCSNACPASVNVPGFVSLVGEERYDEALKLHRERNPLASICARVCFHPCESKCRRAEPRRRRSPSATSSASWSSRRRTPQLPEIHGQRRERRRARSPSSAPAPPASPRAYFLARLGYKPVVFEAEPKAGGMLVQAIPAYRLPRDELEREVDDDRAPWASPSSTARRSAATSRSRASRTRATRPCSSASAPRRACGIGIPGEDGPGVSTASRSSSSTTSSGTGEVGKNVAVIGGGNAAIDAARTALRLGAESGHDPLPPHAGADARVGRGDRRRRPRGHRDHDARRPGGDRPRRERQGHRRALQGDGARRLRQERPPPPGGRPQPRLRGRGRHGHRRHRPVARRAGRPGRHPVELNRWGYLAADPNTGQTSIDWVFAGGDAATGPSSVVEAIGAGEQAAAGIDQFLTGANHAFWRRDIEPPTFFDPDADPDWSSRARGRGAGRGAPRHQLRRGRAELGREGGRRRGEALPALRLRQVLLVSKES